MGWGTPQLTILWQILLVAKRGGTPKFRLAFFCQGSRQKKRMSKSRILRATFGELEIRRILSMSIPRLLRLHFVLIQDE